MATFTSASLSAPGRAAGEAHPRSGNSRAFLAPVLWPGLFNPYRPELPLQCAGPRPGPGAPSTMTRFETELPAACKLHI